MVNKREQKEEEKKTEKATVNEPEIKEKSILLKRFIVERTKNNKNTRKSL